MFFDNPMLFDLAAQELLRPLAHKISIAPYGGQTGIYRLVRRVVPTNPYGKFEDVL
jgi:hypothetical protein